MTDFAIEAADLHFACAGAEIVKGLSFRIRRREVFIVIGPNGSGKTTLMKILAGLHEARGRLRILGKGIAEFSRKALARRVAFVPQQLPADFPFTVREVVLMGRAPHLGLLGIETAMDHDLAQEAMAITGVAEFGDRHLSQLSGGELQRVFIARALCQTPEIMLLDEPTAFLDLAHQIQIMDLLENLRDRQEMTVVMVSHDINLAAMYGDRILLLKGGRAVCEGAPRDILRYETIEDAYGCTVLADRNPLGDFPRITPVPGRFMDKSLMERLRNED